MKFKCLLSGCERHVDHHEIQVHVDAHHAETLKRAKQALSDMRAPDRAVLLQQYCNGCGWERMNGACPNEACASKVGVDFSQLPEQCAAHSGSRGNVRCELPKGHTGWHSSGSLGWAP